MFAASTYKEIEAIEKKNENIEIIILMFVRPTNQFAKDIIREFEYIHYNAGKHCSIFAVGYSNDFCKSTDKTYKRIDSLLDSEWYFSNKAFIEFKEELKSRIKWSYSGETDLLILQNNPGSNKPLNFTNYVAINVNKGIREGYIDSFQGFMESLITISRSEVTAKEAILGVRKQRISLKGIISSTLDDCKKIPLPVKTIVKDGLFYRCANRL